MSDTARSPEFLIENILPSNEVHLLGGPSGAGKTTWLFQALSEQWKAGGEILGQRVHPVDYLYVSADRSERGVRRTMMRAGANPDRIPHLSLTAHPSVVDISKLASVAREHNPSVKLIILDGVMRLVPPRKDSSTDGGFAHVSKFLTGLCKLCSDQDLTFILIVHSPKQKEDSRYTNPRERVMGSAAWAAFSETILLIEPFLPVSKDTANARTLICLPRNAPAMFEDLEFNGIGRLVARSEDLDEVLVEQFLKSIADGAEFSTSQFETALEKRMARSTIYVWLKRLEASGRTTKTGRGIYRKNRPA